MKKLLYNFPVLPFVVVGMTVLWRSVTGKEPALTFVIAVFGFILAYVAFSLLLIAKRPLRLTASSRYWQIIVGALCLATCVSVPITHWPLHLAYQISQPELNRIARELQTGKSFSGPMRVGLFWIKQAKIEEFNDVVSLWTDLDPSGRSGFVLHPPDNVPFNLWTQIELDSRWQYVRED